MINHGLNHVRSCAVSLRKAGSRNSSGLYPYLRLEDFEKFRFFPGLSRIEHSLHRQLIVVRLLRGYA